MKIADATVIAGKRAISRSYAKINLTLDVLSLREDGYHEIETLMQTVGLFDLVIVDRTDRGISLATNLKYLPVNEKNIAYKAAALFFERTGILGGARILIHKNIPVAAGLAGGSGNAAAVLASLNMLYNKPLSDDELLSEAVKLGADVPFCLEGGTCLCRGIGEIMSPSAPFPKRHVLLVKPPLSVSTREIYEALDSEEQFPHPKTEELLSSLTKDSYSPDKLFNVMERVTVKKHPVIGGIKEKMLLNGAEAALMSGSGPTVFGLFDDFKKAKASADSFSYLYKEVYLTSIN